MFRLNTLTLYVSWLVTCSLGMAVQRGAATPSSIPQLMSMLSQIIGPSPGSMSLEDLGNAYIEHGIPQLAVTDLPQTGVDSYNNTNPIEPNTPIYPQKVSSDAPYSLTEEELRGVIYIPPSFQYGSNGRMPVVCVPPTALYGSTYYYYTNFAKYLLEDTFLDPVWLNIPGHSWGDFQVNAEYAAYAMNYISGISSNSNITVLSFSQGGPSTHWVTKYWPSTREIISDHIAISPDFHGTVEASILAPILLSPPALVQQGYSSKLITALRSNGGDSAYVPTTTIYSGTDEVVQPQQGTVASAFLLDSRKVGVSNNYLQGLCPLQPAGSFFTHEGVGYNPLTFALIQDAISHNGPGQASRLNLPGLCKQYTSSVFTLQDVLNFEASIPFALATFILYQGQEYVLGIEPPIMAYAQ